MGAHLWVLPWLSLIVGAASLVVVLTRALRPPPTDAPPPAKLPNIGPSVIIWLLLLAPGVWLELRIGDQLGVDYIGARGLLLGAVAGALLVWLSSRPGPSPMQSIFAVAVTSLSIARLWLTHGEVTGLTAVALGGAVSVVCFSWMLDTPARWACAAGITLIGTISSAMQLGFSRAEEISRMFWPDIPLLAAAAAALGLLPVGRALQREIAEAATLKSRAGRFLASLIPPLCLGAVAWWMGAVLVRDNTPLKIAAFGLAVFVVLAGLFRRRAPASTAEPTHPYASAVAGVVLLLAAITVAYTYWAGYGIALLLLGGWAVMSACAPSGMARLAPPLAMGLLLAIHRALTLQNSDLLDGTMLTDTWNLLALAAGVALALAGCQPTRLAPALAAAAPLPPPDDPNPRAALFSALAALRTVLLLTVSVALLGYLFATESSDGIVIGAALALAALTIVGGPESDNPPLPSEERASLGEAPGVRAGWRLGPEVVTAALLLGFFVLQMMPLMAHWKQPTRPARVDAVIVMTVVGAAAALLPIRRRPKAQPPTAGAEA